MRQLWHDRSQFPAPTMPAHKYMEENDFAVILATKRSAGVALETNLKEHVTYRPIPSVSKAAHWI